MEGSGCLARLGGEGFVVEDDVRNAVIGSDLLSEMFQK
jgi:hypothetical protein